MWLRNWDKDQIHTPRDTWNVPSWLRSYMHNKSSSILHFIVILIDVHLSITLNRVADLYLSGTCSCTKDRHLCDMSYNNVFLCKYMKSCGKKNSRRSFPHYCKRDLYGQQDGCFCRHNLWLPHLSLDPVAY